MDPALFLDRDGTLIRDVGYLSDAARIRWFPGARRKLAELSRAGYRLVVITNQSGVARGYFEEEAVLEVHEAMRRELRSATGADLDALYYCPHHPEGSVGAYARECECRKPGEGLFRRAIRERSIDAGRSIAIGDRAADLIPARRCGVGSCRLFAPDGAGRLPEGRLPEELAPVTEVLRRWEDLEVEGERPAPGPP